MCTHVHTCVRARNRSQNTLLDVVGVLQSRARPTVAAVAPVNPIRSERKLTLSKENNVGGAAWHSAIGACLCVRPSVQVYVRMRVGFPASTYVASFALPQLQHMVLALSTSATPAYSTNTPGMYTPIYPSKDYIPAQRSMDAKEASSLLNKAAAKLNIDGAMFECVEHPPARSAPKLPPPPQENPPTRPPPPWDNLKPTEKTEMLAGYAEDVQRAEGDRTADARGPTRHTVEAARQSAVLRPELEALERRHAAEMQRLKAEVERLSRGTRANVKPKTIAFDTGDEPPPQPPARGPRQPHAAKSSTMSPTSATSPTPTSSFDNLDARAALEHRQRLAQGGSNAQEKGAGVDWVERAAHAEDPRHVADPPRPSAAVWAELEAFEQRHAADMRRLKAVLDRERFETDAQPPIQRPRNDSGMQQALVFPGTDVGECRRRIWQSATVCVRALECVGVSVGRRLIYA